MLFERSLGLEQRQSLQISTQTIQSLNILQFSHEDLVAYVEEQAERNPLIELRAPACITGGSAPSEHGATPRQTLSTPRSAAQTEDIDTIGTRCSQPITLRDHLYHQIGLVFRNSEDRRIAAELVETIDADGYLRTSTGAVANALDVDTARVEAVLAVVHTLEPAGVGARSLAECLRLQLAERGLLCATMDRVLNHLDLLARLDIARLAAFAETDRDTVLRLARLIRTLDPRPGRRFGADPILPALPDVIVTLSDESSLFVEVNSDILPRVLVNREYCATISASARNEMARKFVIDCLAHANFLVRNLDQRTQTLLKVATEIALQQEQFLRHGAQHLRPLGLKDVAKAVGVHESTVCRAMADKFMMTPQGMFEFRFFLSNSIAGADGADDQSSETVRQKIRQLIEAETAETVLSDDAIVAQLRRDGVELARRTVAKYREALRIPSSLQRRRVIHSGLGLRCA